MSPAPSQMDTVWTAANKVTLLRILLIPVFVVAILSPWPAYFPQWEQAEFWKPWVAALVFIGIAMTDSIDGHLARSRGEVTNLGKFMDPLADKILVAAALLALVELGPLPSWVALVILAREFIVSGLRMVAANQNLVIAASWYGKAKTVLQIIAIVLFIVKDSGLVVGMGPDAFNALYVVSWTAMAAALIMTIVSMLDYFAKTSAALGFTNKNAGRAGGDSLDGVDNPATGGEDAHRDGADGIDSADEDSMVVADEDMRAASFSHDDVHDLAQRVIEVATAQGKTLATAESCTGGRIGAALTHGAGASSAVVGGVISYANEVKRDILGVPQGVLDSVGAVSEETARAMAEGARRTTNADIAVSVTGIAGPDGAVPGKPVGTVWIGICTAGGSRAELHHFDGDRAHVRSQAVAAALTLMLSELES